MLGFAVRFQNVALPRRWTWRSGSPYLLAVFVGTWTLWKRRTGGERKNHLLPKTFLGHLVLKVLNFRSIINKRHHGNALVAALFALALSSQAGACVRVTRPQCPCFGLINEMCLQQRGSR
jgi:hypothetical protein